MSQGMVIASDPEIRCHLGRYPGLEFRIHSDPHGALFLIQKRSARRRITHHGIQGNGPFKPVHHHLTLCSGEQMMPVIEIPRQHQSEPCT